MAYQKLYVVGGQKNVPFEEFFLSPKGTFFHGGTNRSVKITPDININPIYVGIERSFPDDSKNVSFIDMVLV